ncbi:MAG: glycosyltransferase family 1 protein [Ardenticatenia bacterium]|nr:glycosyltransferase family 1 protein [Ardenticatenia bacterium]
MIRHIAVEYTAGIAQGGGVGRYTRGLVAALVALKEDEIYTLVHARDVDPDSAAPWPPGTRRRTWPFSQRHMALFWHRLGVPLAAERFLGPVDVFFSPDFVLPPLRRARGVVTVHDLSFLAAPTFHEPGLRRYLARAVARSVRRAEHIFADSEFTKRELERLLNVTANRVHVVYPGVASRFRPYDPTLEADRAHLEQVRAAFGLHIPFILSVGTLEPRKNIDGLIRAYAELRRRGLTRHELVIAGGRGWLNHERELYALVDALGLGGHVLFLGYVDDALLPALYNLADLFAFVSHYEGFGLPVLEAMACGVPTVCAHTTSLPEVGGEAVLYVDDPKDTAAIADALARGLEDEALREHLRHAGPHQAAQFTWEAAARRARSVLVGTGGGR